MFLQNLESDLKIDINLYISNINMLNEKRIQDQKAEFHNSKYSNQIMHSEDNLYE
jgi:hypothetical protein